MSATAHATVIVTEEDLVPASEQSATEICDCVRAIFEGLNTAEQQQVATLLQPLPRARDGKEKKLAEQQRALFALLLAVCNREEDTLYEIFQTSKHYNVLPLSNFLKRFLLSERCCRSHVRRYLSFCHEQLDMPFAYRAVTEGVFSSTFSLAFRSEVLDITRVRAYLARETPFNHSLFT